MAIRLATLGDMELLERFEQNGDELAFAQIVRRYRSLVYAACVRILCDRALAEDAAQETFFRLMQRPAAVSRSLSGWLHRAATQLSIDILRNESARRRREVAYQQQRVEQPMRWSDLSPIVDRCLDELPASTRTLLIDHFLEGTSQKEIAAKRDTSEATVSRHMHKALEKLRKKLRAKGVAFTIGGLTGLLLAHAVQAAPPALCTQLGRMALASGVRHALCGATAGTGAAAGASSSTSIGLGGAFISQLNSTTPGATAAAANASIIKSAALIAILVAITVAATCLLLHFSHATPSSALQAEQDPLTISLLLPPTQLTYNPLHDND